MAEATNKELLTRIDERTKRLMSDYTELRNAIVGSEGDKGMKGDVLLNTTAIEQIKASTLRRDEFWQKILFISIGFLLTNIAGIMGGIVIALKLLSDTK